MHTRKRFSDLRPIFWVQVTAGVLVALLAGLVWLLASRGRLGDALLVAAGAGMVAAVAIAGAWLLLRPRLLESTIRVRMRLSFVLMALLPAVGISLGSAGLGYVGARQQTLDRLESVAALKDAELSAWAKSLQDVLLTVLNDQFAAARANIILDLSNRDKYVDWYSGALRRQLRVLVAASPGIEELLLIDCTGKVAVSSDQDHEGWSVGSRPFYQAGLSNPTVSVPFRSGENEPWAGGPWVFAFRPVTGDEGQPLGVVAGRASLALLSATLSDRTGLGTTGKLCLADPATGRLLVAPVPQTRAEATGEPGSRLASWDTNGSRVLPRVGRPGQYPDFRGNQVLGAYRRLAIPDVVLAAEQDLTEAFGLVYATLGVNVGIALAAVLLAAVASMLITRSITRPLVDLVDTATRITEGDLDREAPVQRRDEVGSLAVAFNTMTSQLRDLITNLEHRVAERTGALQEATRLAQWHAVQLQTSAEVGREITSILSSDELLGRVVELIKAAYGYYDVTVRLLEGDELVVRASTSALSAAPRTSSTTVSVNSEAVRTKQPVQVDDVTLDPRYVPDDRLPDARSELVLPLRLRDSVLGTMDVVSAQPAAFMDEDVLVLQSLADQVAVAIENARLYGRSRELAVVEERDRLARDLHDSLIQSLYSLNLLAEGWARRAAKGEHLDGEEYPHRVVQLTGQALREMRLMVHELRPDILEREGLLGALHQRLEAVERRAGIDARVVVDELVALAKHVEDGLYWIAREALNNALKHASASQVTVRLHRTDSAVTLGVSDNGCGFDYPAAIRKGGSGLSNMQQRAQRLGGELVVITAPGAGTTVRATVPSGPGAEAAAGGLGS